MPAKKQLPFLFTPPIIRYLKDIQEQYDTRSQGQLDQENILPFYIEFETYLQSEPFYSHYETMRKELVDYLEHIGAVSHIYISGISYRNADDSKMASSPEPFIYEQKFALTVLKIEAIRKLIAAQHESSKTSLLSKDEYDTLWKINYDEDTGTIWSNKTPYKITSSARRALFMTLWDNHSHKYKGGETWHPKPVNISSLVVKLKMPKTKLLADVNNLRSYLRAKIGGKINIRRKDGAVFMTVEE